MSGRAARRRFKEPVNHPPEQWKLSPVDLASLDKWEDYTRAKEAMASLETDTARFALDGCRKASLAKSAPV
ncbi:MAG: hypothetical protein IPI16_22255 [Comamonadaceae bacterium]|nr:hypothetical protein [Comamonadaceae bacterium]